MTGAKAPTRELLSVVLPTFNELANLEAMYTALKETLDPLDLDYELIFVDDQSEDGTVEKLRELRTGDERVKYVIMSRRYGDQPCLMAGLKAAAGDAVVTMDADLQHPPRYLPEMLEHWRAGTEVVVMKREEAGHSSAFEKWTEILFYKLLGWLSPSPVFYRFAGFALLDRRAVAALNRFEEDNPFLRGLIGQVGFKRLELTYREDERPSGTTKYTFLQMTRLALSGLTSNTVLPLHLALYLGLAAVALSLLGGLWLLGSALFGDGGSGLGVLLLTLIFFAGVQLSALGILGIYLGKTFLATKRRPNYIVVETGGLKLE